MLIRWLDTRIARAALVVAFIAISTLALMPAHDVPVSSGWDKLDHWTAFFTLTFLASHAFLRKPFWLIALGLFFYGVGIEVAQSFTPDRDADAMDVVADSIGILIYGLVLFLRFTFLKQTPRAE